MKSLFEKRKKVGIIGPSNVGKSTFFNLMLKKKKALVKNIEGITRDFLIEEIVLGSVRFDLVDTGGISTKKDILSKAITENVYSHLSSFDLILFILDQKSQTLYEAKDILMKIKSTHKPFLTVMNKIDEQDNASFYESEFSQLGVPMVPASFENRKGIQFIKRWILKHLKSEKKSSLKIENSNLVLKKNFTHLVLVGRTNVGKSLLKNKILGYQRMLVSHQEGTTFDPVKTSFQLNQVDYFLTDTAGFKKKNQVKEKIESLSHFFSKKVLKKADVVLLVIDVLGQKISRQDLKIARFAMEAKKALILVLNKIDYEKDFKLKKDVSIRKVFRESIKKEFHFFPNVPALFTSAKTGLGIKQLFEKIESVSKELQFKIPTASLNQFLRKSVFKTGPEAKVMKNQFKFFYSTQINQNPPSFVIFGKNADHIQTNKKRFLMKSIQKNWNLKSVPLKLFFKEKS